MAVGERAHRKDPRLGALNPGFGLVVVFWFGLGFLVREEFPNQQLSLQDMFRRLETAPCLQLRW